jgi:hypothetical protein
MISRGCENFLVQKKKTVDTVLFFTIMIFTWAAEPFDSCPSGPQAPLPDLVGALQARRSDFPGGNTYVVTR